MGMMWVLLMVIVVLLLFQVELSSSANSELSSAAQETSSDKPVPTTTSSNLRANNNGNSNTNSNDSKDSKVTKDKRTTTNEKPTMAKVGSPNDLQDDNKEQKKKNKPPKPGPSPASTPNASNKQKQPKKQKSKPGSSNNSTTSSKFRTMAFEDPTDTAMMSHEAFPDYIRHIIRPETCIWIDVSTRNHIRSGNRAVMLDAIVHFLSQCSGVYHGMAKTNNKEDALLFPPFFWSINKNITIPEGVSNAEVYETVLHYAANYCKYGTIASFSQVLNTSICDPPLHYRISYPSQLWEHLHPHQMTRFYHDFDWLEHDHLAWRQSMENILVMYFRGGDILRVNAHPKYYQAPCCLFKQAYTMSTMKYVMLIYDEAVNIHPCIAVMKKLIPKEKLLVAPCTSPICAYNLLGRARELVISGVSTFVHTAIMMFAGIRRVKYEYFCNGSINGTVGNDTLRCITGNSTGLIPWSYTDKTKEIMLTRSCALV